MEDANEYDLSQFRRWYFQSGTPVLEVSCEYDPSAKRLDLHVEQSCPPTPGQETKQPFHIPLALGLLSRDGRDIRLETDPDVLANVSQGEEHYTAVLHVKGQKQTFSFRNVDSEPVPSLLRGFSAPVKLDYDYTRDDLLFLMSHDRDGFSRWEAGQRLAIAVIQDVIGQIQRAGSVEIDPRLVEACQNVLNQAMARGSDDLVDKSMIAAMLMLPSEDYLGEFMEVVDVDAIHAARELVRGEIATQLKGLLLSVYKLHQTDDLYQPFEPDMGQRALKNVALAYLMQPRDTDMVPLCELQFERADNMTDTSAALSALVNSSSENARSVKEHALAEFYNRWADEALVIDQWFRVQASCQLPDTFGRVQNLMKHPAFSLENPNRMRSLVSAFASQNHVNFHRRDGEGYRFLAERVIELNRINPQMAARVVQPLTRWRRFDQARQSLMKAELERILATEDLSKDVYEVASKSV